MKKNNIRKYSFIAAYAIGIIFVVLSFINPTTKISTTDFDLKLNQKLLELNPGESISQSFKANYANINSIDMVLFNSVQMSNDTKVRVEVLDQESKIVASSELYWFESTDMNFFHLSIEDVQNLKGDQFTIIVTAINEPIKVLIGESLSKGIKEINEKYTLMLLINYKNIDYSTAWFPIFFIAIVFSLQTFYIGGNDNE